MKHYIARTILLLLLLAAGLSSCVKDDNSNCPASRVALRFVFTHNTEYTDLFHELVDNVDVYIFDAGDRYVYNLSVPQKSLSNGNTLYLDLEEGDYKIVVWGNLHDAGYGVDAPEQTRADYTVSVLDNNPHISDLFYGMVSLSVLENEETTGEVSLIRDTNIIRIKIIGLPEQTRVIPDTDYSVRITGSNTVYDFLNNPSTGSTAATYVPDYSSALEGNVYVVSSEFKVQRLFIGDDVRMTIQEGDDPKLDGSLTQQILSTYKEINTNDDLDRHYEYELYYELTSEGIFVFLGNNILNWEGPGMPGEL